MTDTVEALLAREAIRELLAEYCFLLDDQELDALGALFEPSGSWISRNGEANGLEVITGFLGRLVPAPDPKLPSWLPVVMCLTRRPRLPQPAPKRP